MQNSLTPHDLILLLVGMALGALALGNAIEGPGDSRRAYHVRAVCFLCMSLIYSYLIYRQLPTWIVAQSLALLEATLAVAATVIAYRKVPVRNISIKTIEWGLYVRAAGVGIGFLLLLILGTLFGPAIMAGLNPSYSVLLDVLTFAFVLAAIFSLFRQQTQHEKPIRFQRSRMALWAFTMTWGTFFTGVFGHAHDRWYLSNAMAFLLIVVSVMNLAQTYESHKGERS